MKKVLLGAMVAASALLACGSASAAVTIDAENFKPYAGVDYKFMSGLDKVEFDGLAGVKNITSKHTNMLGVTAGIQLNDYIGVEASYGKAIERLKTPVIITDIDSYTGPNGEEVYYGEFIKTDKVDFEHITAGVTGQYPIADKVYAKALIGAAWQRFDAGSVYDGYFDGDKFGGASSQIAVTSNNDAVFLGKVGLGYQSTQHSLFEINYTREGELDGVGLQYKYVF